MEESKFEASKRYCIGSNKCCGNNFSINSDGCGKIIKNDYTQHPMTAIATNKRSDKEPAFGGLFNKVLVGMYITKVIYSDPATIVFWSDGTKTMSKAQEGDKYSKETGLTLCVLKKLVGGNQVANLINDWVYEDQKVVDLKFVRYMSKHTSSSKDKE